MTTTPDPFTVKVRVRQEVDYKFDITLDEVERLEFHEWSGGESPTPALLVEFLNAGDIDVDHRLIPANEVSASTDQLEVAGR